jgi:Tfp pilus assembly protein PilO
MGLREETGTSRKRQQVLAIVLVVVVLAGAFLVYMPNRQLRREIQQKITVAEATAAANAQRVTALPQLIAEVKQLRNQVDRYKPLMGRSDFEHAMDEISKIKESTTVANYGLKTLAETMKSACVEQPLEINFTSDFIDAMSLVQRVEGMNRLTRMRELSMHRVEKSDKGGRGVVSVRMKVSLFYADGLQ